MTIENHQQLILCEGAEKGVGREEDMQNYIHNDQQLVVLFETLKCGSKFALILLYYLHNFEKNP